MGTYYLNYDDEDEDIYGPFGTDEDDRDREEDEENLIEYITNH